MFFDKYLREDADIHADELDDIIPVDPDTIEGEEKLADQVEDAMAAQALDTVEFFDGGEDALKEFVESDEVKNVVNEAFGFNKKKTLVRLGRKDELKRRQGIAELLLARDAKDPIFVKLAINRKKERKYREELHKKYGQKAMKIALKSQKKHAKFKIAFPKLPKFFHREEQ
jgi:hypothetical protein